MGNSHSHTHSHFGGSNDLAQSNSSSPLSASRSNSPTPSSHRHISIGHALDVQSTRSSSPNDHSSHPSFYGALPPFSSGNSEPCPRTRVLSQSRRSSRTSSRRTPTSVAMYIQPDATQASSSASILNCTIYSALNNAPLIRIVTDDTYISGYTVFEYMVPTDPSPSPSAPGSPSPSSLSGVDPLSDILASIGGPFPHAFSLTSKSDPFALVEWPNATRKLQLSARQPGTRIRKVETSASVEVKGVIPKMPTGRWLEPVRSHNDEVWYRRMVIGDTAYTWVGQHGHRNVRDPMLHQAHFAHDNPSETRRPIVTIHENQLSGSVRCEMATGANGQTLMSLECCVVAIVLFLSGREIDQTMTPPPRA